MIQHMSLFCPHLPLPPPLLTVLLDTGFLSVPQHTRHSPASGPLHLLLFSHYTLLQNTHMVHLSHVVLWLRIKMIIYVCVFTHIGSRQFEKLYLLFWGQSILIQN